MKKELPYLLLTVATAATVLLAHPSPAPAQASGEDPAVTALISELITQQAALQENQAKIDAQLAIIAEDVRQSRLFAARGGR